MILIVKTHTFSMIDSFLGNSTLFPSTKLMLLKTQVTVTGYASLIGL